MEVHRLAPAVIGHQIKDAFRIAKDLAPSGSISEKPIIGFRRCKNHLLIEIRTPLFEICSPQTTVVLFCSTTQAKFAWLGLLSRTSELDQ